MQGGGRRSRCFPFVGMVGSKGLVGFRSLLAARAVGEGEISVVSFRWNGWMQELGRVPFVSCGQGRRRRVRGDGVSDACYPPGGGATTICTADNRGTNSTARI